MCWKSQGLRISDTFLRLWPAAIGCEIHKTSSSPGFYNTAACLDLNSYIKSACIGDTHRVLECHYVLLIGFLTLVEYLPQNKCNALAFSQPSKSHISHGRIHLESARISAVRARSITSSVNFRISLCYAVITIMHRAHQNLKLFPQWLVQLEAVQAKQKEMAAGGGNPDHSSKFWVSSPTKELEDEGQVDGVIDEPLIDFSGDQEKETCETGSDNAEFVIVESVSLPPTEDLVKQEEDKLCGYLNKLGARGLVKTYKTRWFTFAENTCKLFYYRSPQDIMPLGEIDISTASLSFDVGNTEKPGAFQIRLLDFFIQPKTRGGGGGGGGGGGVESRNKV